MKMRPCADCGPVPVFHFTERLSAVIDWILHPLAEPIEAVWRRFLPGFALLHPERFADKLFHRLSALGIVSVIKKPDDKSNRRTVCLWEEAERRGIEMYEVRPLNLARNTFVAKFGGEIKIFDGLPRPGLTRSPGLSWMDNKAIMRKKFQSAGIPVARGGVCFTKRCALRTFREIGGAVIVKPHIGSRTRHTSLHVTDETALLAAVRKAKQLSPWVIIEEELEGLLLRPTVVGGKLVGVISKEAPHVTGDGRRTVQTLVKEENKNPARQGPIFHLVPTDQEAERELARQGLNWESVPDKGAYVTLGQKTSRGVGGSTEDYTDRAHPENKKLFEKAAAVLEDPLVGIDVIMKDITRPWQEQKRSGIIECNSVPFIDLHHHPLYGEPRNIAAELWDIVFPKTAPTKL